jgi:hypothetical protein
MLGRWEESVHHHLFRATDTLAEYIRRVLDATNVAACGCQQQNGLASPLIYPCPMIRRDMMEGSHPWKHMKETNEGTVALEPSPLRWCVGIEACGVCVSSVVTMYGNRSRRPWQVE